MSERAGVSRNGESQQASWQLLWQTQLTEPGQRKVVLGLGNIFLGDEGLGIHALSYLENRLGSRASVEWIDGGVLGMNLMPLVEQCSHLLVIDAVDAGRAPGTVIELSMLRLLRPLGYRISQHQVTFQDVLGLAKVLDRMPEHVQLVGLQPGSLETGAELSQPVTEALPALAARVQTVLQGWGLIA